MTRCGRRAGHCIVSLQTALQFLLTESIDTRAEEEADCRTAVPGVNERWDLLLSRQLCFPIVVLSVCAPIGRPPSLRLGSARRETRDGLHECFLRRHS